MLRKKRSHHIGPSEHVDMVAESWYRAFWETHDHARANAVARAGARARTREQERQQKPNIQKQTVDVVKVIP